MRAKVCVQRRKSSLFRDEDAATRSRRFAAARAAL